MIDRRSLLAGVGATAAARHLGPPDRRSLRVMAWNIYRGGRGVTESNVGVGPENLRLLLDQLVSTAADVYLTVETYGSGQTIVEALNQRYGRGTYTGHAITQRDDDTDNLWIITRLEVEHVLPRPATGGLVTDFNLGGLRVGKQGRSFNVFVAWLQYTDPWIGYLIDENAAAVRAGLTPRHSAAAVAKEDRLQTDQLREMLDVHLPAMLGDNTDPVIIGGDFNTNAASDWAAAWKDAPEHFGLAYALTATTVLTEAGFVDTYRAAHPEAGDDQGRTWSPLPTERMITPSRIDFVMSKGVDVSTSATIDRRLRSHPEGPFYSDHAAVVTDFHINAT